MLDEEQRKMFMSKLTFILTKADLITPPAWYLIKNSSQYFFMPDKETEEILNQKIIYYRDTFLKPFDKYIVSQAVNEYDEIESITNYGFSVSENKESILFNGFLDSEKMNFLIDKFPKYKTLFQRLNNNYNIIPCSSLFNYNLKKIVLAIMNKIEDSAIFRIENFLDTENIYKTDINRAKKLGNIVLYDLSKKETLYDLSKSNVFNYKL